MADVVLVVDVVDGRQDFVYQSSSLLLTVCACMASDSRTSISHGALIEAGRYVCTLVYVSRLSHRGIGCSPVVPFRTLCLGYDSVKQLSAETQLSDEMQIVGVLVDINQLDDGRVVHCAQNLNLSLE